ncbi:MAG: hypothetical protein V1834_02370 [Candidatus Micrarchaeota archaeon]
MSKPILFDLTPVLRLPVDKSVWKKMDGGSVGKPGVYWWTLDLSHFFFKEGEPYHGVSHGEFLSCGDEIVLNLALDNQKNANGVYSMSFTETGFSFLTNNNQKTGEDLKVLRAALELSSHLPDPSIKTPVQSALVSQLQRTAVKAEKLWDRV